MVEVEDIKNIDIREHIKVRYCERIIGLDTVVGGKEELERIYSIANPKTRKEELDRQIRMYIAVNSERIVDDIRTMFLHSDFIYKGAFGGDNTTKNFYLRDDIILISEVQRHRLITLYRVDFGFGEKNRELVQWLREGILRLQDVVECTRAQVEDFVLTKKIENLQYDDEIKNLEARLEAIRKLKKANTDAIDAEQSKLVLATRELESKVHQLCNNYDYKKDLMAGE